MDAFPPQNHLIAGHPLRRFLVNGRFTAELRSGASPFSGIAQFPARLVNSRAETFVQRKIYVALHHFHAIYEFTQSTATKEMPPDGHYRSKDRQGGESRGRDR